MMTIGQNYTLAFRRLGRSFGKHLFAMFILSLPWVLCTLIGVGASAYALWKTGFSVDDIGLFLGMEITGQLTDEIIVENQLDMNVIHRAALVIICVEAASVVVSLFGILMTLPQAAYFLSVAKNDGLMLKDALKLMLKGIPTTLLVGVLTFLWSLLLIVPGIIKALSYSQALYIKARNPEMGACECITKSREMMNKRKGKLFLLLFVTMLIMAVAEGFVSAFISIVFGAALSILNAEMAYIIMEVIIGVAACAATVVLNVYMNTTLALFHEDVRREYLSDIEQDLRYAHESGSDDVHSNPFM